MQFVVIAKDGTDPEAPERRARARQAHLEGVMKMKEEGKIVAGGAILDDEGGMIGSVAMVEFPSRAELDAWLATDPYVTGDVWRDIEIKPFKVAV